MMILMSRELIGIAAVCWQVMAWKSNRMELIFGHNHVKNPTQQDSHGPNDEPKTINIITST
jgi:hypothetical protein